MKGGAIFVLPESFETSCRGGVFTLLPRGATVLKLGLCGKFFSHENYNRKEGCMETKVESGTVARGLTGRV